MSGKRTRGAFHLLTLRRRRMCFIAVAELSSGRRGRLLPVQIGKDVVGTSVDWTAFEEVLGGGAAQPRSVVGRRERGRWDKKLASFDADRQSSQSQRAAAKTTFTLDFLLLHPKSRLNMK